MRVPDGRFCPYYHVDRDRWHEGPSRCNLLPREDLSHWHEGLCASCPVPDILRANACPRMHLRLRLRAAFFRRRKFEVRAFCEVGGEVADPYVGCGQCHGPLEFVVAEET